MSESVLSPTATEPVSPPPRTASDDPSIDRNRLPPRGGLALGTLLGATISLSVALVLGGLTAVQLHREERRELAIREGLLAESLAPLAAEIEGSSGLDEISQKMSYSTRAERARGHSDFNLVLSDGDSRVVISTFPGADVTPPPDSLMARTTLRSALLKAGGGTLTAWQNSSGFAAEMASRRRAAWLDILATVLAIILVVQLTVYLLVTRPLNHLLTAIEKLELGYPATLRQDAVARELRWLAWRFHCMSAALTNSARLLVAAHRRAVEVSKTRSIPDADLRLIDPLDLDRRGQSADHEILRRYLRSRCALLEGCQPGDPRAREIALYAWERDAVEAEKLGEMELRARVENGALSVLDPMTFNRVNDELKGLIDARAVWCATIEGTIKTALAADNVSLVAIQRRTKHAAGVWRKMQEKNLRLEEVHDLFAFRIVVANQDNCYLALETVHRLFEPEPFRFKDYIAEPKANGYQSLHTSIRDRDGFVFEVQIRTVEMHYAAEEGVAAHWRYRAGKSIQA